MLNINNLDKEYKITNRKKHIALDGIDLEFNKGEFVAIYGQSGSGKSTLLNMIGVLDRPDKGNVAFNYDVINNRKSVNKNVSEFRRRKIGFVFQDFHLLPHLSVIDNVLLPLALDGISSSNAKERATELLTDMGLKDHLYKKPGELSGGEQQRVAIARALANNPDIILADEPTGPLDTKTSDVILKILKDISARGKLVIVVTHDDNILNYATRVVRIKDGRIYKDDKLDDVVTRNESVTNIKRGKFYNPFKQGLKIALKNIKQMKTRFFITSLAASISIIGILVALGIGNSADRYIYSMGEKYSNPQVLTFFKDVPKNSISTIRVNFVEADINNLLQDDRIKAVYLNSAVNINYVFEEDSDEKYNIRLYSLFSTIDDISDVHERELMYGRKPVEDNNEIILTYSMATYYASQLGLEENIESILDKNIIIKVRSNTLQSMEYEYIEFKIVGIFEKDAFHRNKNQDFNRYAYVPSKALDKMIESYSSVSNQDMTASVVSNSKEDTKSLKKQYTDYEMIFAGIKAINNGTLTAFSNLIGTITYFIYALVAISAFVAIIMIAIVLHINVVERINEIGIIKAIGARKIDIRSIYLIEAIMIGLSMSLIGIVTTLIIKNIINSSIIRLFDWKYDFPPMYINVNSLLIAAIFSLTISVIASIYSVNYAANVDPIKAMKK